jgi:glucose/arabinose dehydrogenase
MIETMRGSWILITLFAVACGSKTPPPPSTGPGTGTAESITGRERIGWDQQAGDATELATFRYAIYVDGVRSEVADASCANSAGSSGFFCSGRLPTMSSGAHTLELATFNVAGGDSVESSRSSPLRVVVTAALSAAAASEWQGGEIETTSDGIRLRVDKRAEGLDRPVDAAFAPDGRLFIAERNGRIRVVAQGALQNPDALVLPEDDPGARQAALSIAVDPDFEHTHIVFVAHTAESAKGPVIRLSRYRELRGVLAERAVLFESPTVSTADASAVARFGPDGKLYLAVNGEGTDGVLFRLNADGTLPRDQAGTTPAIATGIVGARGLGWDPRSGILWIADDDSERSHLSGVSMSAPPVRAIVRDRHALPPGIGPIAFYVSDVLPGMRGDALIASAEGFILRLRFADDDATRVARSARLLEERVGPIRVVAVGPDGAIYFCTDDALGSLTAVQ